MILETSGMNPTQATRALRYVLARFAESDETRPALIARH
jgi:hypothetical protein